MAGAQHRSVTGMDERTLGRIDLILFDADYRDAQAAVQDSWRVAVLAADPSLRTAHERARAAAVREANQRRDPTAPQVPNSSTLHRVGLGAALVAGVVAVALLTGRGLAVRDVMLPVGLLAIGSVALLCWLEPRRANGSLWGSRVPAVIHLGLGSMWLLAAGFVLGFRSAEFGPVGALSALAGLALLALAGVLAVILAGYAHAADRSGRQTGLARVTADLIDSTDASWVFEVLDRWWRATGPEALHRSPTRVRAVRLEVLARLRAGRLISQTDEALASQASEPVRWAERRR